MAMSGPWVVFVLASSNLFLSQFYRATNAVISPQLLKDLSLDTEGLGLLSASFFYSFALAQIPITVFLDRIGPRRLMVALSILGIMGILLFSEADSLAVGVVGRLLLGVGMACNLTGALKLLTLWFPPARFATLSGIVFSIGYGGNIAATTPFVLAVNLVGWRVALQVIAGVNLILILLFNSAARDQPREVAFPPTRTNSQNLRDSLSLLRELLKKRDFWIISFGTFSSYGIFSAFQVLWAGPYLMEVMGLSPEGAGNTIFLANIGLIVGGSAWGPVSDRVLKTRKWIVVVGHLLLALVTLCMAALPPRTSFAVLAILFFCFGFFRTTGLLMYSQVKELVPLNMAGMAMTGINFFTMVGSAVFLQGLGSLMQAIYPHASRGPAAFRLVFLLCSGFLISVGVLYGLTTERKNRKTTITDARKTPNGRRS
jgi:sugar phosphate permease